LELNVFFKFHNHMRLPPFRRQWRFASHGNNTDCFDGRFIPVTGPEKGRVMFLYRKIENP